MSLGGVLFADEGCCVLMIVRGQKKSVVVLSDDVVEWDCVE